LSTGKWHQLKLLVFRLRFPADPDLFRQHQLQHSFDGFLPHSLPALGEACATTAGLWLEASAKDVECPGNLVITKASTADELRNLNALLDRFDDRQALHNPLYKSRNPEHRIELSHLRGIEK
jgi:hypothetical protein